MTNDRRTVREITLDVLRANGVDRIFGNPGSTELAFLHDWPTDIDYVLGLEEGCVIGMADGYAQATGRPAFVNLHSAAGLGHGLGNLFTAFRNKTPLVVTAGQQARSILPLRPYLFAERATEFPRPYVKWSIEPARAEDVPAAIAQAFLIASQHPRGPTFVSIPSDDWARPAAEVPVRRISGEFPADPAAIRRLAGAVGAARRPVFVVGAEVDRSGAVATMTAVAERARAEVWAAPMSSRSSFPERHPLFAGFLAASPPHLSAALAEADLVVVCGAPVFTFHVEGACPLLGDGTPIWQLTNDPEEAASAGNGESILGTLDTALSQLLDCLPVTDRPSPSQGPLPTPPHAAIPLPPAYVLDRLAAALPEDSIVVEEAPSHRTAIQRHLPRPGTDSFYTMASGGLGYSMPASIGVALARPKRRVVCLIGDGSSMYSIQAIWTAVRYRVPVIFLVLNNEGYGAMRAFSRIMAIERPPGIDLPGIDFVSLAEGLGCEARRVTNADDLDEALAHGLASTGPVLVDIVVDAAMGGLFEKAASDADQASGR